MQLHCDITTCIIHKIINEILYVYTHVNVGVPTQIMKKVQKKQWRLKSITHENKASFCSRILFKGLYIFHTRVFHCASVRLV